MKILFLAANPRTTTLLQLRAEANEIHNSLQKAGAADKFRLIEKWAVDSTTLRRELLDENPDIVHFSGHGTGTEGLVLVGKNDEPKPAAGDTLAELFRVVNKIRIESGMSRVRCVLLNACYAEEQARAIFQHIDNVIGMRREVKDDAAIAFAIGFYDGLARKLPIKSAFDLGCVAVQMELASFSHKTRKLIVVLDEARGDFEPIPDHLIPILFSRESGAIDSASIPMELLSEGLKEGDISKVEALRQYREDVQRFLAAGMLTATEAFHLSTRATALRLTGEEANQILEEEQDRLEKFREKVKEVPDLSRLTNQQRHNLEQCGKDLGLSELEIYQILEEEERDDRIFSVASIESADPNRQNVSGTGFTIFRDDQYTYILTCNNIVRSVGGQDNLRMNIGIKAVVESESEEFNLAILRVENGRLLRTPLPLCASGERGKEFTTMGFYKDALNASLKSREVTGHLVGAAAYGSTTIWDFKISDDNKLNPSYIGSPVFDATTGYVLGIISDLKDEGTRGSAISIKALTRVWSTIPENLIRSSWVFDRILNGHSARVNSIIFNPSNNSTLFSSGGDGLIKQWKLDNRNNKAFSADIIGNHAKEIRSISVTRDGKTLISGSQSGRIRVWDVDNPGSPKYYSDSGLHTARINSVSVDPEGLLLASSSDDRTIKIWQAKNIIKKPTILNFAAPIYDLKVHVDDVRSIAVNWDKNLLVSGSNDNYVRIINLESEKVVGEFRHAGKVNAVAISSDGQTVVSGSADSTIKIWSFLGEEFNFTLAGHTSAVLSIAISPDNRTLASGGTDGTVRIWDLENRGVLFVYSKHQSEVRTVAFSPDGKFLASGSADTTIKIWKISRF